MRRQQTLRERVEGRIAERRDEVFLPREFRDLGGEDQVLRVLRGLTRDGRLRLTGQPMLAAQDGFIGAVKAGPRQAWRGLGTNRISARL